MMRNHTHVQKLLQITNNSNITLQTKGKSSIKSSFVSATLIKETKTDLKAVIPQFLLYHFGVMFDVLFEFTEKELLQAMHAQHYLIMNHEKIT